MKFLKWLGILIFTILVLFLTIPAFLSSSYHIERETIVQKHVEVVFLAATDMDLRQKWDPWIETDPGAEVKVTMLPEIIGSGYHWKGEVIGEGKIEIIEFIPNQLIKSKLTFIAPQPMESNAIWNFESTEEGTKITWAFEGEFSYLYKWSGLLMDKMIGESFEKGLSNFKKLVEKIPDTMGRTGKVYETTFDGIKALSITKECNSDRLTSCMFDMYTTILSHLKNNKLEIYGKPFSIYHPSDKEGITILECALPIETKIKGNGNIKYIELPKTKVVVATHFGHFKTTKTSHKVIKEFISENNYITSGTPWEMYITDPTKEFNQNKWETHIYYPIE